VIRPTPGTGHTLHGLKEFYPTSKALAVLCMPNSLYIGGAERRQGCTSNFDMQRGMLGSLCRHVCTVPPLRPVIDMPLPANPTKM